MRVDFGVSSPSSIRPPSRMRDRRVVPVNSACSSEVRQASGSSRMPAPAPRRTGLPPATPRKLDARHQRQRRPDGAQLPGVGVPINDPGHQALQVGQLAQRGLDSSPRSATSSSSACTASSRLLRSSRRRVGAARSSCAAAARPWRVWSCPARPAASPGCSWRAAWFRSAPGCAGWWRQAPDSFRADW